MPEEFNMTNHIIVRKPKGRSWKMWAHDYGEHGFNHASPDKKWVEIHGLSEPVVPVEVYEDKEGTMLGWLDKNDDYPTMIWHKKIFEICFPYGSAAEVAAGKGVVLQLSIRRRENED